MNSSDKQNVIKFDPKHRRQTLNGKGAQTKKAAFHRLGKVGLYLQFFIFLVLIAYFLKECQGG